MLLNRKYYRDLWDKYKNIETLEHNLNDKLSLLTLKIIIEHYKNKKPIHFNFQCFDDILQNLGKRLYIELANKVFNNYPDLPASFNVGDKLKHIIENKTYEIISKSGNRFTLREIIRTRKRLNYPAEKPGLTYDDFCLRYIKIEAGIRDTTIQRYFNFFREINHLNNKNFIPTNFERKSVFIGPKTFYDSLEVKNKIPTTYFPNPREGNNPHETKSIPALPDSIMYFAPKYEVCYQKLLLPRKTKIDTIIVFDTEEEKIQQIINDKQQYGFNLIVLTNTTTPTKCNQVPCWNWFKEEIEIVNSL